MCVVVMVVGRVLVIGMSVLFKDNFLSVSVVLVVFLGMMFSVVKSVMVMGRLKWLFFLGRFVGDRFIVICFEGSVMDNVFMVV